MKRYESLANEIAESIREGIWRAGDRLPSVRQLGRQRGISPATVFSAYYLLESWGLVRAHERSGYYVLGRPALRLPAFGAAQAVAQGDAVRPETIDRVFDVLGSILRRDLVPLGSAFPCPLLFPLEQLGRVTGHAARGMDPWSSVDNLSMGDIRLRRGIARRYAAAGSVVHADEVVVTNGAMEALNLCLMTVARPGDAVAVESPAFYGVFQALERLGLRAIEVPTHPQYGMDLDVLEQVLETQRPAACWLMSHFQNPMGSVMPDAAKQRMAQMAARFRLPVIEDDVYGELYFGREAPRPIKSWDSEGWVMHCASFSKTLAPGYRVGWVAPGRFVEPLARQKLTLSLAGSAPAQAALGEYLEKGAYDKQLRLLRHTLLKTQDEMLRVIASRFPRETRSTRPEGGYFLWLELPREVDAMQLFRDALSEGLSLAPGPLFTAREGAYANCIRLNYGHPWSAEIDGALNWIANQLSAYRKSI